MNKMPRKFRIVGSVSVVGLVFFLLFAPTLTVSSLEEQITSETGCDGTTTVYYSGALKSPQNTYDVYVKLGTRGQQAVVSGYIQPDDETLKCQLLGSVNASGDEWRKLGSYTDPGTDMVVYQIASVALSDIPTANRPTVMLLPHDNPACVPKAECETTLDGQRAYVRAPSNTLTDNALRIVRVDSIGSSQIVGVKYYVDNELMYTTKQLEAFDLRSVPYYGNKLFRVVDYASGQSVVLEGNIPPEHIDDLSSMLVRTFRKYRDIVLVAIAVILVLVFVKMIKSLIVHIELHREWKIAHGLIPQKPEPELTPERKKLLYRRQMVRGFYAITEVALLVVIFAAGVVLVLSAYVVQIGSVSGRSMVASYENGQKIMIDKLPVTAARINNEFYTPKRGEVVIAHPNFGGGETSASGTEENTIIKRVIGLPGDRLVLSNGHITVYNKEHKDGFDPSAGTKWAPNVQSDETAIYIDITLAENEVFLCGDNRPESIDSRFNGPINTSQIVGIVHEL